MSLNNMLNALIALVEERPKAARDFLRAPGSPKFYVGEVHSRLSSSLMRRDDIAQIRVLKQIIYKTLRIDPDEGKPSDWTEHGRDIFLAGVTEVERIIDAAITDLEAKSEVMARSDPSDSMHINR